CSKAAVAPRADSGVGVLVSTAGSACEGDCGTSGAPASTAPADPGPVVAWLHLYEMQEPAVIARDDPAVGSYVRTAIERWPRTWQLHEYLASWNVRAGDLEAARVAHADAKALYMEAPLYDDPWLGWRGKVAIVAFGNTFAGPVGWLLGKGVVAAVDAAAGDVLVPFPDEPGPLAWQPPPTAHPPAGS
ncbi:MAG: hypothetical protein ACKOCT_06935, partial [Alphaproteobacteria bacterium]